jgi:hypothetical protein
MYLMQNLQEQTHNTDDRISTESTRFGRTLAAPNKFLFLPLNRELTLNPESG